MRLKRKTEIVVCLANLDAWMATKKAAGFFAEMKRLAQLEDDIDFLMSSTARIVHRRLTAVALQAVKGEARRANRNEAIVHEFEKRRLRAQVSKGYFVADAVWPFGRNTLV